MGVVLYSGSARHGGLTRGYITKARDQGMPIPNDESVKACLKQVCCDPIQFREDEDFIRTDLNPLLIGLTQLSL